LLYIAIETRRFEIERFCQRSLFFWGFIAAAFVGHAALGKEGLWEATVMMGCFGLVASLAWSLQKKPRRQILAGSMGAESRAAGATPLGYQAFS
jgi:hypothetical protein